MAQSKNGTDNLSNDLINLLDRASKNAKAATDFRRISAGEDYARNYRRLTLEELVIYITNRDGKVFDHAYDLGKKDGSGRQ